jgi:methylated-DNA-[protein]-cysteine S-methyltransferase
MEKIIYKSPLSLILSIEVSRETIIKTSLETSNESFICKIYNSTPAINLSIQLWLKAYLNKKNPANYLPLIIPSTAKFSSAVLKALFHQPFGSFLTYKSLAKLADSPKAFRATGTVCKNNPLPFFIPCHRVLSSNSIGGFRYGLDIKKKLLAFETCSSQLTDPAIYQNAYD